MRIPYLCITAILLLLSGSGSSLAGSYMAMPLEDLMNLTVTSISKRDQPLQETAAAVYVITGEDLRRTGVTSIPEALRMVPGFMVGQHDANTWAVSARGRGLNPTFEDKLLFLIDGRSKYCPIFGGVFWDSIEFMPEDIDRIEVIRGPGSSIWGSNAVNGIVNVITKSAAETRGGMVSALYGSTEQGTAGLRYGGRFSPESAWRVFAKHRRVDDLHDMDGRKFRGALESNYAGFRTDTEPDGRSRFALQGSAAASRTRDTILRPDLSAASIVEYNVPSDMEDVALQASWSRSLGDTASVSLQGFLSHFHIDTSDVYDITEDTADLDFQHQFSPLAGHTAQWGVALRHVRTRMRTDPQTISFARERRTDTLASAFVQDEISFVDGRWLLTLGSKFEHNEQTGLEILPSARLLWRASGRHAFWTAVSRSARIPSIAEQDVYYHLDIQKIEGLPPVRISLTGDPDADAERVLIWELGHRFTPSSSFFLDTALFATRADNLFSQSIDLSSASLRMSPEPHVQIDGNGGNDVRGITYGLELSATWEAASWWRLRGWYAYFEDSYRFRGEGINVFEPVYGRISPRHQLFFRSSMDLPHNTEADIMFRYVSEQPGLEVPDHATLDARLGWKPVENMEISLTGKNLLTSRHKETASGLVFGDGMGVDRSCYLKLRMDF